LPRILWKWMWLRRKMWLWRMQQYLSGTCYNYDAGFSGKTFLEHCPLNCKEIFCLRNVSCISYKKDYYGVKCQSKGNSNKILDM
jgi:hypothetical protein